jgi:hypothetical protein
MKELFDTVNNYKTNIDNLNKIVINEQDRLEEKQKNVDTALFTQNRMIEFNESLRKRYADFNYIIIVFVIGFAIIFLLIMLARFFTFIPVYPLIGVVLFIVIFLSLKKYYNISSRWNMDYDKYNLKPPVLQNTNLYLKLGQGGTGQDQGTQGQCVGSQCCSTETVWDKLKNSCVLPTLPTSTTTTKDTFNNMSANEFENYSKY